MSVLSCIHNLRVAKKTEKQLEATRAWKRRNRERVSEYNRQYDKANRERRREIDRRYKARHRGQLAASQREYIASLDPEELRQIKRAEYERNLANYRSNSRRYYAEKREEHLRKAKEWRKNNPRKAQLHAKRMKALRRGAPLDATAIEYVEVLMGDPCSYCGGEGGTLDHIEPLVHGGDSSWDNLTNACLRCNSRKNAHSLLLSMLWRVGQEANAA